MELVDEEGRLFTGDDIAEILRIFLVTWQHSGRPTNNSNSNHYNNNSSFNFRSVSGYVNKNNAGNNGGNVSPKRASSINGLSGLPRLNSLRSRSPRLELEAIIEATRAEDERLTEQRLLKAQLAEAQAPMQQIVTLSQEVAEVRGELRGLVSSVDSLRADLSLLVRTLQQQQQAAASSSPSAANVRPESS